MTSTAQLPVDALAGHGDAAVQQQAARMAQDAFSRAFRLTFEEDDTGRALGVAELELALRNWSRAAGSEEAQSLRLALLIAGIDQWGLAYSQAFQLQAIPAVSELLGALRTGLDPREEARLLQQFGAVDAAEGNAIDFKIELRRAIHLALWHAMVASEEREQAMSILARLGGMLVAVTRAMPELGWRLVADTLANIQIRCVAEGLAAEGLAQETTQALFGALSQELAPELRDRIMAHANQALIGWMQSRRPPSVQPS